jgi:hypothetical protein
MILASIVMERAQLKSMTTLGKIIWRATAKVLRMMVSPQRLWTLQLNCEPTYIEGTDLVDQLVEAQLSQNTIIYPSNDYAEVAAFPSESEYAGKTNDAPPPDFVFTTYTYANILIPKKWIIENIELAASWILSYRAFGGRNAKSTSDQSNSGAPGCWIYVLYPP